MPIPQAHVSGWDEATTDEKLQALYDWCIILTDEVRAAKADNRALLERVKKLEGEASIQTGGIDGSAGPRRDSHHPSGTANLENFSKALVCVAIEPN
jgi:hypothetical protein